MRLTEKTEKRRGYLGKRSKRHDVYLTMKVLCVVAIVTASVTGESSFGLGIVGLSPLLASAKIDDDLKSGVSPELHIEQAAYVPIAAYDGDLVDTPVVKAVPRAQIQLDGNGRPIGLIGPRVRIELAENIAVEINRRTLEKGETVANPLLYFATSRDGSLVSATDRVSAALATAFVTANRVIENAERWAGRYIEWGADGQLVLYPIAFIGDVSFSYYDGIDKAVFLGATWKGTTRGGKVQRRISAQDIILDAASSPDIVAHESAHAVLAEIKPGHVSGMSVALHEALSDATTFLLAFDDPAVVTRIMEETAGDLRRTNEATRFREKRSHPEQGTSFWRSIGAQIAISDCGLDRNETDLLPPVLATASGSKDPHRVGQVISGALYELFVRVYERSVFSGNNVWTAITDAKDTVGSLMLRSLRFVGEHRVSFGDYAIALMRVDRDYYDGRNRAALITVLSRRGLVDADVDIDLEIEKRRMLVPLFTLNPLTKDPAMILDALENLETSQLVKVREIDWLLRDERTKIPLLRHRATAFITEIAGADELSLHSDVGTVDGSRIIRIRHRVLRFGVHLRDNAPLWPTDWTNPDSMPEILRTSYADAFVGLVFDKSGSLIALHTDKPFSKQR